MLHVTPLAALLAFIVITAQTGIISIWSVPQKHPFLKGQFKALVRVCIPRNGLAMESIIGEK